MFAQFPLISDDLCRLLSEFKELKIKCREILQAVDSAIGSGSAKLSRETMSLVEDLLKEYCSLQEEMKICTEKVNELVCGVTAKLNDLAAISNPKFAFKLESDDLPDIQKVAQKRGRRSKKLPNVSHTVGGLNLLVNAVSLVSLEVKKEPAAKTNKVPITKFIRKSRKRGKNSDAGGSKDEEQSDDIDDATNDSGGKSDENLFCVCNRPSHGSMVCCDNVSSCNFKSKSVPTIISHSFQGLVFYRMVSL